MDQFLRRHGCRNRALDQDTALIYHIPYRLSDSRQEIPNLLVAGRCISVDHRVHHATKEIPACMATGEAAGTAAALAVRAGIDPVDLEVGTLRARLGEKGAILS